MVEKKHVKWSLILAFLFIFLAIASAIVYALIPSIISTMTGVSGGCDSSDGAYTSESTKNIGTALSKLCDTSQSFFGTLVMILFVVCGVFSLVPMVLVSIDAAQSKSLSDLRKLLWLAATWLILGPIAAAVYYFVEMKEN